MSSLKQRIFEFARVPQLMSVATVTAQGAPRVRYVVGRADEGLTFRFSTHLDSAKVAQLQADPRVAVTMGATDVRATAWLELEGRAEVSTAESERHGFWFPGLAAHFSGLDDPRYCVVCIRPTAITLGAERWTSG
jgi:general stress protein 26